MVGLGDESHTFALKPMHRGFMVEDAQHAFHQFVATRISLGKVANALKRIGEVSLSAFFYGNLGKRTCTCLKHLYYGIRIVSL